MDDKTKAYIQILAEKYETQEFIPKDPISFPHRYKDKKDIEIAAFVAQWLAYGKRELFLKVLAKIGEDFKGKPYLYIKNREFDKYKDDKRVLYRFFTYGDYYLLCSCLYDIYFVEGKETMTMEEVLKQELKTDKVNDAIVLLQLIGKKFSCVKGIPHDVSSACKRLCMFLRWMIRKKSEVDFGLWDIMEAEDLLIPVDVHVLRQSMALNLTTKKTATIKTVIEITANMKQIFPFDPTKADFALFGLGVDENQEK